MDHRKITLEGQLEALRILIDRAKAEIAKWEVEVEALLAELESHLGKKVPEPPKAAEPEPVRPPTRRVKKTE